MMDEDPYVETFHHATVYPVERTNFLEPIPKGWRWVVHNAVAHPLLVFCPPVGRWLHDRTAP